MYKAVLWPFGFLFSPVVSIPLLPTVCPSENGKSMIYCLNFRLQGNKTSWRVCRVLISIVCLDIWMDLPQWWRLKLLRGRGRGVSMTVFWILRHDHNHSGLSGSSCTPLQLVNIGHCWATAMFHALCVSSVWRYSVGLLQGSVCKEKEGKQRWVRQGI